MSSVPSPAERGPWHRRLLARYHWRRHTLLKFIDELAGWKGDVARIDIGGRAIFLFKHPDQIQQLLVAEHARTFKARTAERDRFFLFLGDGLLNSRGETHRRQRRLVMPAFHRGRLAGYADTIVASAQTLAASWTDGEIRDLAPAMTGLTLTAIGRTLFSSDVADAGGGVAAAFNALKVNIEQANLLGSSWFGRGRFHGERITAAQDTLNDLVVGLIKDRRGRKNDSGDLLSMLLLAEDAENPGEALSDGEIRDQVMTLIFAGFETVAHALTWTLWLVSSHPEVERRWHEELREALGGKAPTFDDVGRLPLTEQIVRESMRIYPPVWALGRMAATDLALGETAVPKDSLMIASQWRVHRDPRWFAHPLEFRPDRWSPAFRGSLPRFAYFPFGGGPRSCLGEHFAWMELILILATLGQRWRFETTAPSQGLIPAAGITLRPDRPAWMRFHQR